MTGFKKPNEKQKQLLLKVQIMLVLQVLYDFLQ